MPEVIEVCITAIYLNHILKNKHLDLLKIVGGRYKKKDMKNIDVLKKLYPLEIKSVNSKGKFMWFTLQHTANGVTTELYIMNTFGLSGIWSINKQKNSDIEFHIKEDIIDDAKLMNKNHKSHNIVYFSDQMHYGTLEIETDKRNLEKKLDKLGDDLLKSTYRLSDIKDRLKNVCDRSNKNDKIVQVLMDQTKKGGIGSGIGNYLVAEIMYDAKISPHTKVCDLAVDDTKITKLYKSIKYVIKLSYMTADIGYMEYIDDYTTKYMNKIRKAISSGTNHKYNFLSDVNIQPNKKFTFRVYGQKFDPLNNEVKKEIIINPDQKNKRTTHWVPSIQK